MILCCVDEKSVEGGHASQLATGGDTWGNTSADFKVTAMVSAVVTAFKDRAPKWFPITSSISAR